VTSSESGLARAIADFLSHSRAQGGSPRTTDHYTVTLTRIFLPWCVAEGITEPNQLDQAALNRFNNHLLTRPGRPLAKESVRSYLRPVRLFLGWTAKAGLTADGVNVQRVKAERKVLDTLSRAEIAEMEAAADSERDKLIIRLLGDSGIRLGELLALKPSSLTVQGRDHLITVDGKGSRQRLVPIKPAVAARLKRYAERGRPADAITERIFITRRRRPSGDYEALTGRAVQTMLKAVAAKVGITKRVNPHSFRHSMATNMLRGGSNPIALAQILGHSDLTMLQRTYSHLVVSDLSRDMMRVLAADDE
jgi:site-specific recombinase XerD